jgi:protein-S-isoprenylcysteine O-methyltransferase Ste14
VPKWFAIGLVCGIGWGAVAGVVFLAMFRGSIAAPGEAALPLAMVIVGLYLPFVIAAGIETAAGRPSPSLGEIVGVTLASGAGLGLLVAAGIALIQRLVRSAQSRT